MNDTAHKFAALYDTIHERNSRLVALRPQRLILTTMTMCGTITSFEDKKIPLSDINQNLGRYYDIVETQKKRTPESKVFLNQISLKADTVSVKVFTNGSVQGTGVKSAVHFVDILDRVCSTLGEYMDHAPSLERVSIECINSTFSTLKQLPLTKLREVFRQQGYEATYNPDSFSAVQIKIPISEESYQVKIHIFSTGRINFSACKDPSDIFLAYDIVCTILDTVAGDLVDKGPSTTSISKNVLKTYSIVNGYSNRIYYLCMYEFDKKISL